MGPHDIGWAVFALKQGTSVRRPHWGEGFYVHAAKLNAPNGTDWIVNVLLIHMPSLNRVQPFTCHHDDLLATDWELA